MFRIGDTVYIRRSVAVTDGKGYNTIVRFSTTEWVEKPARVDGIDGKVLTITFEDDQEVAVVNVDWLARWVDFANVEQVEQYLEER